MGSSAQEAYFEPLGSDGDWEVFQASEHTVSAWGPDLQHGAPPSALLTRAMERLAPSPERRIARVAVDLLGPVPVGEVRTRARVARDGRRIQLVEADLVCGDRLVARASAWRLRCGDTSAVEQAATESRALPAHSHGPDFLEVWSSGFIDSLEIRLSADGIVWARTPYALVAGEQVTPIERVMGIADIANGVGAVLDPMQWRFLNTDLVVHVHRLPEGEWIGIDAAASIGGDGVGATSGTVYDTRGAIGHTLQALLVEPV